MPNPSEWVTQFIDGLKEIATNAGIFSLRLAIAGIGFIFIVIGLIMLAEGPIKFVGKRVATVKAGKALVS